MIPASFEYHRARTIDEALELLAKYGEDAKILAGGQSLLPMMKLRLASPGHLVDISEVAQLKELREADGLIRIGAAATETALLRSALLRGKCPLIGEAAAQIGDPQIRNRGTLGGNLAHGDPGNDHPSVMIALGASVIARGPAGERRLPMDGFYRGLYDTQLEPLELLTEIQVPTPPARSGAAYLKLKRKIGDFATAASAVQLSLGEGDTCARIGIALTNVAPMPLRLSGAEALLAGKRITAELIEQAAQIATGACDAADDFHGPPEYRAQMAGEMTRRALAGALERARRN